jgi:hypothetical protein
MYHNNRHNYTQLYTIILHIHYNDAYYYDTYDTYQGWSVLQGDHSASNVCISGFNRYVSIEEVGFIGVSYVG